eukprot:CAMPEP_0203668172 /NCGR_PEP_ID=MMETSP0090-20130426/4866_1 /ASSEMBLY_ACC=CAM_ASM_001088 /TAXON_ID=426623 /ORGANISM="Chaetoceros affinis, Strain CCMP159" /LENGTH=969 /DNA_ID=CAMNT_0050532539 /DNA_START=88 /DNA_END=2993 /DNA_ORIENTATION=+
MGVVRDYVAFISKIMMTPPPNKKQSVDYTRSPSIPSEIGTGDNFHAYFLEDSESDPSTCARLGIARPSYNAPDQLDFSPVLQSRKRAPKTKSALEKYNRVGSFQIDELARNGGQAAVGGVVGIRGNTYSATSQKYTGQLPALLPPPEQSLNTGLSSASRMKQKDKRKSPNKKKAQAYADSNIGNAFTQNTAPFRKPKQALFQLSKSKQIKSPSRRQFLISSGEESLSTIDMDGSIDLNGSFHPPMNKPRSHRVIDNNRFFTPAQQSVYKNYPITKHRRRKIRTTAPSSPSTCRSITSTITPNSVSSPEKSVGLGISPAPRSAARIIVPHVSPTNSKSKHLYTVFILLIQPTQKIFELVRINYDSATATLKDLLKRVTENCSEEDLSNQKYIGFVRPNGSSSSNRNLTNLSLSASLMARDGSCARIVCGEVLAAIPEKFTSKETQILARHIMKNPKMVKLLSKKNPLVKKELPPSAPQSPVRNRAIKANSQLGIQPSNNYYTSENTGTFSSSVLFAPLTDAIDEEVGTTSTAMEKNAMQMQRTPSRGLLSARSGSETTHISGENSCTSSISTATGTFNRVGNTLRNGQHVDQIVSNIELKHKLQTLECTVKNLSAATKGKRPATALIVPDHDDGNINPISEVSLSTAQLEEIKREAAKAATDAARAAAEEAFTKRMEELVQTLDVSDDEKNRLLDNDDMSFHSAISSAMNAAMTPLEVDNTCDFPVSVSISQNPLDAPSNAGVMSSGPYLSEARLVTPYTAPYGDMLLSPMAPRSPLISNMNTSGVASPPSDQGSPHSSDYLSPTSIDPVKSHEPNKSINTTFSQSTMECDYDDEIEIEDSLISEVMKGFCDVTTKAVNKFIKRKKKSMREIPKKILQRKLHLKVMSLVCVLLLSSQAMIRNDDAESDSLPLSKVLVFQNKTSSSRINEADTYRKMSFMDLQQVLFWILVLTKGQSYIQNNRPLRRRRRA